MMTTVPPHPTSIKIPTAQAEQIARLAEATGRSRHNLMLYALRIGLLELERMEALHEQTRPRPPDGPETIELF